jgi:hypothetical protein
MGEGAAGQRGRFFFVVGVKVFLQQFVFGFVWSHQDDFAILSTAGDYFICFADGVLVWLTLAQLMMPL